MADVGYSQTDFEWTVDLANRKISRRTGDEQDAILLLNQDDDKGGVIIAANHHPIVELWARSDNFSDAGASILLGKAQSLAHEESEPLKLRYTPSAGKVYQQQSPMPDELNREQIRLTGRWPSYQRTDLDPLPGGLIAAGMFDDSCDGIISVSVAGNDTLRASARVSSGPPDYSPDTQFLRSIDDEMEQIIKGVAITDDDYPNTDTGDRALVDDIVNIMQRGLDTVRMASPAGLIREWGWNPDSVLDRLQYRGVITRHIEWLHSLGSYRKETLTADEKYQFSIELQGLSARLRLQTGIDVAPDANSWLMPFFMRGSDGGFVVLSERQRDKINYAIQRFAQFAPQSALARLKGVIWAQAEAASSDMRAMHRVVVDQAGQTDLLSIFKEVVTQKESGMEMEQSDAVRKVVDVIQNGSLGATKLILWDRVVDDASLNSSNAPITMYLSAMSEGIKEAIENWITSEMERLIAEEDEDRALDSAGAPIRLNSIDKQDVMFQLRYQALGNPPSTSITSTISNCFPGLEMDFRGVWQRLLRDDAGDADDYQYDWVLHETYNAVLAQGGQSFVGRSSIELTETDGDIIPLDSEDYQAQSELATDRFNRLSHFIHENARDAEGAFDPDATFAVNFRGSSYNLRLNEVVDESTGYIKRPLAGELTHGLCSPWQRDFRDCGCRYWSANRPDFVNVVTDDAGNSTGKDWMSENGQRDDSGTPADSLEYDELFDDWQSKLEFVVKGQTTS